MTVLVVVLTVALAVVSVAAYVLARYLYGVLAALGGFGG